MNAATIIAVGVGGAVGAMSRYGLTHAAQHFLGGAYPVGTLAANLTGSFAMGVLYELFSREGSNTDVVYAFLAIGILGAFTTFSTFSLDAYLLYRDRTIAIAGLYVAVSVALSIAGLLAGIAMTRQLT